MQISVDKNQLQKFINDSTNILVLCAGRGNDALAAAVAMCLYFEKKHKKQVTLIYAGDIDPLDSKLVEMHEVLSKLEDAILKVEIDYKGTSVESVDYYKEGDSKLVLEIKPISLGFDVKRRINYKVEGGSFGLIVTVGAKSLLEFDDVLKLLSKKEGKTPVVNIDNSSKNQKFGNIRIVNAQFGLLSELVLNLLTRLGFSPTKDVAKSLLIGLSLER